LAGLELPVELVARWSQVNLESQNAILQGRRGVANHGVVLKVDSGSLYESLAIRPFDWRQSPALDRVGALAKTKDHVLGIKGFSHSPMLWAQSSGLESVDCMFGTSLFLSLRLAICGTSEELM
jgi:hypothetical protein